jgi:hypothetical protein
MDSTKLDAMTLGQLGELHRDIGRRIEARRALPDPWDAVDFDGGYALYGELVDKPGIRRIELTANVSVSAWDRRRLSDMDVEEWSDHDSQPAWLKPFFIWDGGKKLFDLPLPDADDVITDDYRNKLDGDWDEPLTGDLPVRICLYYEPKYSSRPEGGRSLPAKFVGILPGGLVRNYEIAAGRLRIDGADVGPWRPDMLEEFYVVPDFGAKTDEDTDDDAAAPPPAKRQEKAIAEAPPQPCNGCPAAPQP